MKLIFTLSLSFLLAGGINTMAKKNLPAPEFPVKKNAVSQAAATSPLDARKASKLKATEDWWRPDTVVTYSKNGFPSIEKTSREIFEYDENGNVLTEINQELQSNVWVNKSKITSTYNGEIIQTKLYQVWESNAWVNSYLYTYEPFNSNSKIMLAQKWESNVWVNDTKFIYSYDTNGNMLNSISQKWESNVWTNDQKYVYTYDNNNNILSETSQDWESNTWVNDGMYSSTYDERGNRLSYLYQVWEDNQWRNSYKFIRTYDNNNNLLTLIQQDWDEDENAWDNNSKRTYIYNSQNKESEGLFQLWSSDLNNWKDYGRSTNTYDNAGYLVSNLFLAWSEINSSWKNSTKKEFINDGNGNAIQGFDYAWENGNWAPSEFGSMDMFFNDGQSSWYISGYKGVISYVKTANPTAIPVVQPDKIAGISIFPNPTTDYINVDMQQTGDNTLIQVYNLQGAKCVEKSVQGGGVYSLSLQNLNPGIYFIKIGSNVTKIVKQ